MIINKCFAGVFYFLLCKTKLLGVTHEGGGGVG
jgi:hypothetical protein